MSGHERNDRDDLEEMVAMIRRETPEPPPAPAERMWERISERRAREARVVRPDFRPKRWVRAASWAAAAAAVLVVGVFLGRRTVETGPAPVEALVEGAAPGDVRIETSPYAFVTIDLLDRADALLTDFRSRACEQTGGTVQIASWADGLLSETRLLLDAPDLDDPEVRKLLGDLELTLAQMARLKDDRCTTDRDWIRNGLEERDTVRRLRAVAEARRDRTAL